MSDQSKVPAAAPAMTPVQGLVMLAVVCVVLAIYIAAMAFLGFKDLLWAGVVFVLCWTGFEQTVPAKLLDCAAGSAFGLLLAWCLPLFAVWFGDAGIWVFVGVLLVVVYLQILQVGRTVNNPTAMLYLTVATIPAILGGLHFPSAFLVLGLTVAYFGGLVALMNLVTRRKAAGVARQPA